MILMIIFLVLTVIFIIATVIYLNKKKKNVDTTLNKRKENNSRENIEKNKKNTKKQLSDVLKIKIKDNMICLGNRFSSVLRLGNIDYNMLSINEQESVETILIQTALSIDYPVQFFSTTEFIDTSKVIEEIKKNKPKNERIREYQEYLITYLENLMENRSISVVRNYAIISYDGLFEEAEDELNRKTLAFKSSLLRAKISCDLLDENDLYNLVYRELNKNSSLKIDSLKEGGKKLYVGKKQKNKK